MMINFIAFPTVVGNLGKKTNSIHVADTSVNQSDIKSITKTYLESQEIKAGDIVFITFNDAKSDMYKVMSDYSLKLYAHAA